MSTTLLYFLAAIGGIAVAAFLLLLLCVVVLFLCAKLAQWKIRRDAMKALFAGRVDTPTDATTATSR